MTNKRLDDVLTRIEAALDEVTSAVAHAQQEQADMAVNAADKTQAEPVISPAEMADLRGELAEAMDIVRELQMVDSAPASESDTAPETS